MKKRFFISFFSVAMTFMTTLLSQIPLLIIDTNQKDPYVYAHPFEEIARSVGFAPTYYNIGTFLDSPEKQLQPSTWPIVFFILDAPFLKKLTTSHAAERVLRIIHLFSSTPNVVVGFFFSSDVRFTPQASNDFSLLFKNIEDLNSPTTPQKLLIHFLANPLERRPRLYHTTLKSPTPSTTPAYRTTLSQQTGIDYLSACQTKEIQPYCLLPLNQKPIPKELAPAFPFGLYFFNKHSNNHIICGSSTFFTFLSVEENYHFCPSDIKMQQYLCKTLQQFLWEINLLTQQRKEHRINRNVIDSQHCPTLPSSNPAAPCNSVLVSAQTDYDKTMHTATISIRKTAPLITAWMDIEIFENDEKKKEQELLIKSIFDGNINALWITFSPAMFYSRYGKKKAEKKRFHTTIQKFTKLLAIQAAERNISSPAILIDMEVSNNFEPIDHKPSSPAIDLFGNEYEKCPDPLDRTFWQEEVILPLKEFVRDWEDIGNNIPLSGVMLDLEMYFSPPGTFSSTMGFSLQAFNQFAQKTGLTVNSLEAFIASLINEKQTNAFFSFLQDEACNLGLYLRTEFEKIIPHGMFGYYLDHVSSHWFYKGLSQGLSTREHPLLLLSFNSHFKKHSAWLETNHIYAEHASALLLSKLQKKQDISYWLTTLFADTGHIWINRFSRLIEPYPLLPQDPNAWTRAENTPLSWTNKKELLNQLTLKQNLPEKTDSLVPTLKKMTLLAALISTGFIIYKLLNKTKGLSTP